MPTLQAVMRAASGATSGVWSVVKGIAVMEPPLNLPRMQRESPTFATVSRPLLSNKAVAAVLPESEVLMFGVAISCLLLRGIWRSNISTYSCACKRKAIHESRPNWTERVWTNFGASKRNGRATWSLMRPWSAVPSWGVLMIFHCSHGSRLPTIVDEMALSPRKT